MREATVSDHMPQERGSCAGSVCLQRRRLYESGDGCGCGRIVCLGGARTIERLAARRFGRAALDSTCPNRMGSEAGADFGCGVGRLQNFTTVSVTTAGTGCDDDIGGLNVQSRFVLLYLPLTTRRGVSVAEVQVFGQ